MPTLIKQLQNNRNVIFDKGKFDNWCVYVVESSGIKKAHFDETYFGELSKIATKYKPNKVYEDFTQIYDKTTKAIDPKVLYLIVEITQTYNKEDQIAIEQWFTVIYAGMIAEENKEHAILKKRIKRLGMHQVLILGIPAKDAARFSYQKKWRELDKIMQSLGF